MIIPSLLQAVLDALTDPIVAIDSCGGVMACNRAWLNLQRHLTVLISSVEESKRLTPVYESPYQALGFGLLKQRDVEGITQVQNGVVTTYVTTCTYLLDQEIRTLKLTVCTLTYGYKGLVFTWQDQTKQYLHEAALFYHANLDPLTGLLNRRLFFVEAQRVLALAERHHHPFVVFYLDLDGFKLVNDRNGHDAGDDVLCQVASRLTARLRNGDLLARLGGDEFVLLMPETTEQEGLAAIVRYLDCLKEPYVFQSVSIVLKGSIGVACYPAHGISIEKLVRQADEAMLHAKARGGGVEVYQPESLLAQL